MPVLRVVRFTPQGVGVDTRLRDDLVPDLLRIPGIRGVFAGRMGPGDDGRRLLATVWTSIDAIAPGARGSGGTTGADPEHLADAPGREAETYPLAIAIAPLGPADIGILRLVRGRTRAGALDEYVRQAREGTITDRVLGVGPRALYLGTDGSSRFTTLSLWDEWSDVEAATGSDATGADRTRHAELLTDWTAEHYEVVPGIAIMAPEDLEPGDVG